MKNAIDSIDKRMNQAEERICESEDRTLKLSFHKNKWKRAKKAYMIYEIPSKETTWKLLRSQKKRREKDTEILF